MPERLDPWGAGVPEDYARLMEEFGIRPLEELLPRIPDPPHLMRRGVIFGHRDFERVLERMGGGRYAVMTGLMPSGRMHLGHKMVVDQLIWYQKRGGEIFLCVADMEAFSARGIPYERGREIAFEEYLLNCEALGLELEKCRVYFQSRSQEVQALAYSLARRVNFSEVRAIYGFSGETHLSHLYYPMIDVADILHPQLEEFGGPRPTVVPVGVDQDPHLRLARDVSAKFSEEYGFLPPSSTYHRLMRDLFGGKMSSSRPDSALFLTDPPEVWERKIWDALTGGRPTAREQREKGGEPFKCLVYELCMYHFVPEDRELLELKERCERGEVICGECKEEVVGRVRGFLRELEERRREVRPAVERLLRRISP
ncbi:MAG: tryptophan--tRNA ligase [Candidatus Hadarchaeales archaeon]